MPLGITASAYVVPSGGGGFIPSDFGTNLQMWYESSNVANFTFGTGAFVAQWNDLSTNARHLTSPEDYFSPTRTGTQNGLTVVTTVSNHAYLTKDFTAISQPMTYFAVITIPADTNYNPGWTSAVGNDDAWHHLERFPDTNNMLMAANLVTNLRFAMSGSAWHYITLCYDSTSSYARVDGTQVVSGDTGTFGMHGLTLLANRNQSSATTTAIGEFFGANLHVSGTQLTDAETYLKTKWGL